MGVRIVERKVGRGWVGEVARGWRVSIIRRVPGLLRFWGPFFWILWRDVRLFGDMVVDISF